MFAKNERRYRLNAIKALLIATNLLSVASIRSKLLKPTSPKNVTSIQMQKVVTYNSDRKKKINLIPNKAFYSYNR